MKIYCKVTETGLMPMYGSDLEEKKRLRVGEMVLCEVKKPIWEWRTRLFCIRNSHTIREAEDLLLFLNK